MKSKGKKSFLEMVLVFLLGSSMAKPAPAFVVRVLSLFQNHKMTIALF